MLPRQLKATANGPRLLNILICLPTPLKVAEIAGGMHPKSGRPPARYTSADGEENVKRSTDRILVTHVGSLVRPMSIRGVLSARDYGHPYDQAAYEKTLRREVAAIVRKQADVGIDIVSDGSARRAGSATLPSGSAASCIARSDPEITNTIRSI